MPRVIVADGIVKRYGRRTAVRGISLAVERGEIYGFLGPNGAGKTSVIRVLLGLMPPTEGSYEIFGVARGTRYAAVRARIGALQEKPRFYPELSGRDYLTFFARLYGVESPARRAADALDEVGLTRAADVRSGAYSRGMQQKLCLARAMIHDPDLLILDEPASGLDPLGIAEVRAVLRRLRERGKTIILSSHHLSEIEKVCDRVGIIDRGRMLAEGSIAEVTRGSGDLKVEVRLVEPNAAVGPALEKLDCVLACEADGARIGLRVRDVAGDVRAEVARAAYEAGGMVVSVETRAVTLEEVFVDLVGGLG